MTTLAHFGIMISTAEAMGIGTSRKVAIMPQILGLNPRSNAVQYSPEEVVEVADMLGDVRTGEAVALDPVDSEGKARARARVMKEALKSDHGIDARGHIIEDSTDPDNVIFYPAVSLRKVKAETSDNGKAAAKKNTK